MDQNQHQSHLILSSICLFFKFLRDGQLEKCMELAAIINRTFLEICRYRSSVNKLIDLRFMMQHWRSRTADYFIQEIARDSLSLDSFVIHLKLILLINIQLSPARLQCCCQFYRKYEKKFCAVQQKDILLFLNYQGITVGNKEIQLFAGPQKDLNIKPLKPSQWSYQRWSMTTLNAEYCYREDGVFLKGHLFKSGDMLLMNQNFDDDGVYATTIDQGRYVSHISFVVFIKDHKKVIPAVLEIHEHGIRAIPLYVAISRKIATYLEIFRLKRKPALFSQNLSKTARLLLTQIHPYTFTYNSESPESVNCAEVGKLLFEFMGPFFIKAQAHLHRPLKEKFLEFGLTGSTILTPTDYVLNQNLQIIGVIDNDFFSQTLVREIVVRRLRDRFMMEFFHWKRFKRKYFLMILIVYLIKKGGLSGEFLRNLSGFPKHLFPTGGAELLIFSKHLSLMVKNTVRKISNNPIFSIQGLTPFSILEFEGNQEVIEVFRGLTGDLEKWFISPKSISKKMGVI